jgi:hypothetical protein
MPPEAYRKGTTMESCLTKVQNSHDAITSIMDRFRNSGCKGLPYHILQFPAISILHGLDVAVSYYKILEEKAIPDLLNGLHLVRGKIRDPEQLEYYDEALSQEASAYTYEPYSLTESQYETTREYTSDRARPFSYRIENELEPVTFEEEDEDDLEEEETYEDLLREWFTHPDIWNEEVQAIINSGKLEEYEELCGVKLNLTKVKSQVPEEPPSAIAEVELLIEEKIMEPPKEVVQLTCSDQANSKESFEILPKRKAPDIPKKSKEVIKKYYDFFKEPEVPKPEKKFPSKSVPYGMGDRAEPGDLDGWVFVQKLHRKKKKKLSPFVKKVKNKKTKV